MEWGVVLVHGWIRKSEGQPHGLWDCPRSFRCDDQKFQNSCGGHAFISTARHFGGLWIQEILHSATCVESIVCPPSVFMNSDSSGLSSRSRGIKCDGSGVLFIELSPRPERSHGDRCQTHSPLEGSHPSGAGPRSGVFLIGLSIRSAHGVTVPATSGGGQSPEFEGQPPERWSRCRYILGSHRPSARAVSSLSRCLLGHFFV